MKKITLVLATAFLLNNSFADTTPTTAPATAATSPVAVNNPEPENEAVYINSSLKLVPTIKHTENLALKFAIDTNYPQIGGGTLTPAAEKFNQAMTEMVTQEIDRFTKFVKEDAVHMTTLPVDMQHNSLNIDYDIDVINSSKQPIISVRLSIQGNQGGRPHPYHSYRILNFDLNGGKVLTLNDLFKPNSRYLNIFAKYTSKSLNKSLQDKFMIANGTAPTLKNYQTWNIQSDGILITFNEYQVAPYSDGAQEVEIPFSALKGMLSSDVSKVAS